jgi:hypothetical protein
MQTLATVSGTVEPFMPIREPRITSRELIEAFVSRVTSTMRGEGGRQPFSYDSRPELTEAVLDVLTELGHEKEYSDCYEWLVDLVWWDRSNEYMALAVESELSHASNEIADDFQKLTVLKCPLKLFVFKGDVERTKNMAEEYLKRRSQHVKDEEYLLVGFIKPRPRCFFLKVPNDGVFQEPIQFSEPLSFNY